VSLLIRKRTLNPPNDFHRMTGSWVRQLDPLCARTPHS
jgi:hypothetical protein